MGTVGGWGGGYLRLWRLRCVLGIVRVVSGYSWWVESATGGG